MCGTARNKPWPPFISYLYPRMYADDTHITYAGVDVNSIQLNLNHDLDNLNKWLISSKLTLNTAKTTLRAEALRSS